MAANLFRAAALVGAVLLTLLAVLPPAAKDAGAPAGQFSAGRAMADIRVIARAPHPTGSAELARVRAYLVDRLRGLGLEVSTQAAPLGEQARRRLVGWGEPEAAQLVNIVAVLPGRDRAAPAVGVFAHYETVPGSPGAADDAAGVAAVLEIVRAVLAGPPPARDLVVVLTDAEELSLDGARAFFEHHPLARRLGAVVNLEARGGGGRALMFETGKDAGEAMRLYARAVDRPSANSLTVFVYRLMPNSTDFTIAQSHGASGYNFAFMGRPGLYHSPLAAPEAVDAGSVQHLGAQALDIVRALVTAERLPRRSPDLVFSDVLGLAVLAYPVGAGWGVLAAAAVLMGFAGLRAARAGQARGADLFGGAGRALWLLLHAALLLHLGALVSGAGPSAEYFDRLAAIPRLEAQAVVLALAVLLVSAAATRPSPRWLAALPALALGVASAALGQPAPALLGLALLAAAVSVALPAIPPSRLGGWLGALLILMAFAVAVEAFAPAAGPLIAWPLLLAAAGAAAVSLIDAKAERPASLWPAAMVAAVGAAQVLGAAHIAFLGVGADFAAAMALFALLVGVVAWPLLPRRAGGGLVAAVAVLVVAGAGIALSVRLDPPAASIPTFRR